MIEMKRGDLLRIFDFDGKLTLQAIVSDVSAVEEDDYYTHAVSLIPDPGVGDTPTGS